MDIRVELLKEEITELIKHRIENLDIDADEVVHTVASKVLEEIKTVINNEELSDFMAMDEIVEIFEKYGIDSGGRYDF